MEGKIYNPVGNLAEQTKKKLKILNSALKHMENTCQINAGKDDLCKIPLMLCCCLLGASGLY